MGSNAGNEELARSCAQIVLNQLFAFSSRQFQESVWIRGDHRAGYVQDYREAVELLHDFVPWLTEDGTYHCIQLSDEQAASIKRFMTLVDEFDDKLSVHDAQHALADPRWPAVMSAADRTLKLLQGGPHDLRPGVTNST